MTINKFLINKGVKSNTKMITILQMVQWVDEWQEQEQTEQSPTLIEIDFDGHLKCQLETTDANPKILKGVNGYGQPVDCREGKIRITEL